MCSLTKTKSHIPNNFLEDREFYLSDNRVFLPFSFFLQVCPCFSTLNHACNPLIKPPKLVSPLTNSAALDVDHSHCQL